jgi:hypothetical protein
LKDGTKYILEYHEDAGHGIGMGIHNNGVKYFGEWKNNLKQGYGSYWSPDGQRYIG